MVRRWEKSGNTAIPWRCIQYGADAVRYYFLKEIGKDGDFETRFINVLDRFKWLREFAESDVEHGESTVMRSQLQWGHSLYRRRLVWDLACVLQAYEALAFSQAEVLTVRASNKFIDEQAPGLYINRDSSRRLNRCYTLSESVRLVAYLLSPIFNVSNDISTSSCPTDFNEKQISVALYHPQLGNTKRKPEVGWTRPVFD